MEYLQQDHCIKEPENRTQLEVEEWLLLFLHIKSKPMKVEQFLIF